MEENFYQKMDSFAADDLDTESESKKTSDSAITPEQIVEILANPEARDLLIKLAGMLKENEQMGSEL